MSADGAAPPPPPGGNRIPIAIEEEMKSSFMDYAMSVIVSRALPDARDGLKPVHRRILFTQHAAQQHLEPRRTSSARASSATCSASTTRTATRRSTTRWCAWPRTSRCATRSSTARATSARSTAIRRRPSATPSAAWRSSAASCSPTSTRRPSTSSRTTTTRSSSRRSCRRASRTCSSTAPPASPSAWRPTSRRTTSARSSTRRSRSSRTRTSPTDELIEIVPGPDFPTGGFIYGRHGIRAAYETGRGAILMRGAHQHRGAPEDRAQVDHRHRDPVPGQQGALIEKIAELVRDKKHRGHHRHPRRVRPRRHAHRLRAQEGRRAGGRAQQPLQDDAAAGVVRHQHAGDRRRPPAAPVAQAGAHALHRAPPRRRHAAHAVRSARGARPAAHRRGPGDRRRQHRRVIDLIRVVEGHRGRQDGPDVRASTCRRARPRRSSTCASPS